MKSPILCCLDSRTIDNGSLYGRFLLGPFPIDLSLTVATTLRRGLLHSQPSFGIVSAEIEGAVHEYASLPGVQESVLEILLNLGEVVLTTTHRNLLERNFRNTALLSFAPSVLCKAKEANEEASNNKGIYTASIRFSGPGVITAKDINWPDGVYCVTPDIHIATLSNNETLAMRIKIMSAFEDQTSQTKIKNDFTENSIGVSKESIESLGKKPKIKQESALLTSKSKNGILGIEPQKLVKNSNNYESSDVTLPVKNIKLNGSVPLESKKQDSEKNVGIKTLRSGLSLPALLLYSKSKDSQSASIVQNIKYKSKKFALPASFVNQEAEEAQQTAKIAKGKQEQSLSVFVAKQKQQEKISDESNGPKITQKPLNLSFGLKKDQKISLQELSNIDSFVKKDEKQQRGIELAVSPCSYPVQKVNFVIERDDQWEGYRHRIILEVWTNGSISPRQAIFDTIAWTIKLIYNFREPTRKIEIGKKG